MRECGSRRAAWAATFTVTILLSVSGSAVAQPCGDVNEQNGVTATDALLILQKAVGQPIDLQCRICSSTTSTSSTTTSTTLGLPTTTTVGPTTTTTLAGFPFAGSYSGDYAGDSSGTFDFTVDQAGVLSGAGSSDTTGAFLLSGTVDGAGNADFETDGILQAHRQFIGLIGGGGNAQGTWDNSPLLETGTWQAALQP